MASKIRDRILDHAVRRFSACGYAGCSTKDISQRAEVTEGSLFRLFESKDNLFSEALDTVTLRVAKRQKLRNIDERLLAFAILEDAARVRDSLAKNGFKTKRVPSLALVLR